MIIKRVLLGVLIVFQSCTLIAQRYDFNLLQIDKKAATEKGALSDLFESHEFLVLETREDALIGTIKEAEIHNGKVYIFSRNGSSPILVFSLQTGKLMTKVGVKGRGPGEFIFPFDFTVGPDESVYLLAAKRVIQYDSTGEFIDEFALGFDADKILYHGMDQFAISTYYMEPELIIVDMTFNKIQSYFPFRLYRTSYSDILQHSNGNTYYFNNNFGQIYRIEENGPSGFLEIQILGYKPNKEISQDLIKEIEERGNSLHNEAFNRIKKSGFLQKLLIGNNQIFGLIYSDEQRFILRYSVGDESYVLFDIDKIKADLGKCYNSFFPIILTDEGYLLSYIEPYKLKKEDKQELDPDLYEIVKRIDEQSNPILFIGKLKDF